MTIAFLPGPTQSHSLHVNVALVGVSPRIGFFDDNGMLLDTSFRTYVTDASSNVECTLSFALQVPGKKLYVQAKAHSPVSAWMPSAGDTLVSQSVTIGPTTNPAGLTSNFNVVVCANWGDPNAIWVDPTWPLSKSGSGGPKSVSAPQNTASYFYLTSLGTSSAPKQLTLYVNVATSEDGTPYAWLSNGDGVCVGNILDVYPPVGSTPQETAYCKLMFEPGSIPREWSVSLRNGTSTVSLPTHLNLYYGLSSGAEGSFDILVSGSSNSTATFNYYGETSAPGPIWTNS
jgi:hypothetical protein